MENMSDNNSENEKYTLKDYGTGNSRWCPGCGNFSIISAVKQFFAEEQLPPHDIVNISGIGCSSRSPYYFNTFGVHSIHGRAIPVATGLAITRPDLKLFIHSGDGDAISIGCGHLIHGINKNFNCVFLLYDNELYSLTKNQSSPTTRKGHKTNTQPYGTFLPPIYPTSLALGAGASFVASTASWLPEHLRSIIKAAYAHQGFSFIHITQQCPHFDHDNFDHKDTSWFSFLTHENGITPDKRIADKTEIIEHDPSNKNEAVRYANDEKLYFGLFYQDKNKVCYDHVLQEFTKNTKQIPPSQLLDSFKI